MADTGMADLEMSAEMETLHDISDDLETEESELEGDGNENLFTRAETIMLIDDLVEDKIKHEDLDFLEKYVLSLDRTKTVSKAFDQDTFDYWYWSLLNAQVRGDLESEMKLIEEVAATDFGSAEPIQALMYRRSCIDYSADSAEDVKGKLQDIITDVKLDHQRDHTVGHVDEKAYPTTLDLSTNKLLKRMFTKVQNREASIQEVFTPAAGIWLADKIKSKELTDQQVGDLLELMEDEPPQIPFLLSALQSDFKYGSKFGERKLHDKLTRDTLKLLGEKMKVLFKEEEFLIAYCHKLRSVSDVNVCEHRDMLGEYIKKLIKFIRPNGKAHTTLTGVIMMNYMKFQEEEGKGYDEGLLKEYLALPRAVNQYNPPKKLTKKERRQRERQGLSVEEEVVSGDRTTVLDFGWCPDKLSSELSCIGDDEPFVRRALSALFLQGKKEKDFEKVLSKKFAEVLRSEVMLMAGKGNEKMVAMMIDTIKEAKGPGAYKTLRNRVDLEFEPSSNSVYRVDDDVTLKILSKNNSVIEVNVYRVNAKNYYKSMTQEIPNDINLSGSCPIVSFTVTCDEPAIRKIPHTIDIPQLKGERGVFAVDLTGNGMFLRAVIRKGELRFICDQDSNSNRGHVFKVFNEMNEPITEACIWMDGEEYFADENGDVCLPFSQTDTKTELIVLEDSTLTGSATLQSFTRQFPQYKLECGMYIDREQLRNKEEASVLIRANLYMNTEIISLDRLSNVQLKLVCEDNMGKVRTRIEPITLVDKEETCYTFTVPLELRHVECWLTCQCDGVDLLSKQLLSVNTMNDTMAIGDMFLFPSGAAGYVLGMFGKNGEPMANEEIELRFKHRYFHEPIFHNAMTNENGLCYLGRLYDITQVDASSVSQNVWTDQSFDVLVDMVNLPRLVNRKHGTTMYVPFIADNPRKAPDLYIYDKDYIESFSSCAVYEGYYIAINGLPAGDFILHVRDAQNANIKLCVSDGVEMTTGIGDYVISENRVLQLSEDTPLNVVDVTGSRTEGYEVKIKGFNDLTRVHFVACSNVPPFSLFGFLSSPNCPPTVISFKSPETVYSEATDLNPEYDYIINRKAADKFPGNLLPRPTLCNAGWSDQNPEVRNANPLVYRRQQEIIEKMAAQNTGGMENFGLALKRKEEDNSALEFLGVSSNMVMNLMPDIDGEFATIKISPDQYSNEHNFIQVLVVDDDNTALRNIIFEECEEPTNLTDVRLDPGLDSKKHYAETRTVVCLHKKGDEYVINDFSTAEYEPYEDLEEPYNLYRAACKKTSDREQWVKFEPLVKWARISSEEQLAFYDEFACHEINFYLSRKDPTFFLNVVKPILENKTQKSFMDDYLLQNDLEQYRKLHRFHRLNCFEKILLCSRSGDAEFSRKILGWVTDRANLKQLNPTKLDDIFNLGINSRQLGVEELDKQMASIERSVTQASVFPEEIETYAERTVESLDAIRNSDIFGSEEYLSMTRQHCEMTYFQEDAQSQTCNLIMPNRFWADYARYALEEHDNDGFVSKWFQLATNSLNEMLLALGVLDVPLQGETPERVAMEGGAVKLVANTPVILYLRELIETEERNSAVSVSTNYFDPEERKHMVDGEEQDKFINTFTSNKVFGCRVVVTNVSSVDQRIEVLCQIPTGSIPCGIQCFKTQAYFQDLKPFGTYRREFYFYWPEAGTYSHFPVHINKNQKTVGFGGGMETVEVTQTEVLPDTSSWKYISNLAENVEVLDFLTNNPEVLQVNLEKICWRLNDADFFEQVVDILRSRQIFNDKIWAYSLVSDQKGQALGEFLAWNEEFIDLCGPHLECPLVKIDQEALRDWQTVEFWPFLNPRAHKNDQLSYQDLLQYYWQFLKLLAFKTGNAENISVEDKFMLCQLLILRNKIDEARALYDTIDKAAAQENIPIVADYFEVYLNFMVDPVACADLAKKYNDMQLPKFMKQKFADVIEYLTEAKNPTLSDNYFLEEEYAAQQEASKPFISFELDGDKHEMLVTYRNVTEATINFYITDLEVLFSAHPFQESNTGYKLVTPNHSIEVGLDAKETQVLVKLPNDLKDNNSIVEIVTETLEVVDLYNDNHLDVQLAEDEGELRVLHKRTGNPIEGAYCKVYARSLMTGREEFFKDGYTDLRGRFDYRQLSTDQLRQTSRLSILISTEKLGSIIKECDIPLSFISQSYLPGL